MRPAWNYQNFAIFSLLVGFWNLHDTFWICIPHGRGSGLVCNLLFMDVASCMGDCARPIWDSVLTCHALVMWKRDHRKFKTTCLSVRTRSAHIDGYIKKIIFLSKLYAFVIYSIDIISECPSNTNNYRYKTSHKMHAKKQPGVLNSQGWAALFLWKHQNEPHGHCPNCPLPHLHPSPGNSVMK